MRLLADVAKRASREADGACNNSPVPFSPSDFADDTEFERFALERLGTHRIRVGEPGAVYDVRGTDGNSTSITVSVGAAASGTRARDELRRSLQPLGFGAAYKTLDLLVEHILRANGAPSARLSFQQKASWITNRLALRPVPLDIYVDFLDRLAILYVELQEARHAVTHRRAQVTPSGDLEIYDNARSLVDTMTEAEMAAFAAAVHGVAELVIENVDLDRRANIAAWYLNQLQSRHGLGSLHAIDPNAGRRLLMMNLEELPDGRVRFDLGRASSVVAGQPEQSVWDLQLHLDNRVFVGRWENVPEQESEIEFHPATPPGWLAEEIT